MLFSDLYNKLDSLIIPLHDHEWVMNKLREAVIQTSHHDMTEEEIQKNLDSFSTEIIIGYPVPDNDNNFEFGFKRNGWLDDSSKIDYITSMMWNELEDIIIFGSMESCSEVWYNDDFEDLTIRERKKQIDNLLTHTFGRSLSNDNSIKISNTSDCKKFIISEYGFENMKRTANNKWGNLNYRLFENDNGDEVSIVSYNDKLISHYQFSYKANH